MQRLQKFEINKNQYVKKVEFLKAWGFTDYELGIGATLAFAAVISKTYSGIESFYPDRKINLNDVITKLENLENQGEYVLFLKEDTDDIWERHDLAVSKNEEWVRNDPDSSHEYLITKLANKDIYSYLKQLPYFNDEKKTEGAMSRYYLLDTRQQWIFSLRKHPSGFEIYQK